MEGCMGRSAAWSEAPPSCTSSPLVASALLRGTVTLIAVAGPPGWLEPLLLLLPLRCIRCWGPRLCDWGDCKLRSSSCAVDVVWRPGDVLKM